MARALDKKRTWTIEPPFGRYAGSNRVAAPHQGLRQLKSHEVSSRDSVRTIKRRVAKRKVFPKKEGSVHNLNWDFRMKRAEGPLHKGASHVPFVNWAVTDCGKPGAMILLVRDFGVRVSIFSKRILCFPSRSRQFCPPVLHPVQYP